MCHNHKCATLPVPAALVNVRCGECRQVKMLTDDLIEAHIFQWIAVAVLDQCGFETLLLRA